MSLFKIDSKGSVEHDFKRIDRQYIQKILDSIKSLSKDPFPVQSIKLKNSMSFHRMRVGKYRVIYQVDIESKVITIYHVRHRKDDYKRLDFSDR